MASSIITSIVSGGSNNHATVSEEVNAVATDFVNAGVVGAITNTGGVSPATGSFAINQSGTPAMTVDVSAGQAYVTGTPSGQSSQTLRARMASAYTAYAINANSSGSVKYDWVYLKFDATTAANPSASADDVITLYTSRSTSNTSDNGTPPTYGLVLAVITVANGASSIVNANISDKRVSNTLYNLGLGAGFELTSPSIINFDGWISPSETWVYVSASSFKVSGVNVTAKYPKGTRIKFTQSTVKYGVVVSSAFSTDTTVTIAVNTDYTIANASITANYYSYAASPQGYPTFFNYTPTLTGITVGSGTVSGKFCYTGGTVEHYEIFTFGAGSAVGDTVLTLPIVSATLATYTPVADVSIFDSGTIVYNGIAIWLTTTTAKVYVSNSAGTYNAQTQLSSTVPMTWTTNDQLIITGTYIA